MKRVRAFFESIVFAGLKPGGPKTHETQSKPPGAIRGTLERFLAGGSQPDPLYLTNRTLGQKIRSWSLILVPCLVLAIAVSIALNTFLDPPEVKPAKELSSKEVAAKMLPNMEKDITLTSNSEVQVVEVSINHAGGSRLLGVVKNTTAHEISGVDLTIDLTDATGSQVGAVTVAVEKVPASSTKTFQYPIKQHEAAFALVREIATR
jgi:hypothetical protein